MTAQATDAMVYDGNEYVVIDANRGLLFDPKAFGIDPISLSTACYRGFSCEYAIERGCLVLNQLEISSGDVDPVTRVLTLYPLPLLNGHAAQTGDLQHASFAGLYENLQLPLTYSGNILISRNADNAYPPRFRGCARAWEYDSNLLVTAMDGQVQKVLDVSDKIATFIARYIEGGIEGDMIDGDQRRNARKFWDRQFGPGFSM